jgi:molybdate transport system substrate-binding protein
MRRGLALALVVAGSLAACGHGPDDPAIRVSAAASLKTALTAYGAQFEPARVRLSFAGSDMLAAQIRRGARPDVFASANSTLPDALYVEGLVERPVAFARNRLVLAVPEHGSNVRSLAGAARPRVTLALGSPSVPIGAYTRQMLNRLPTAQRNALLANVRTTEPDVSGIVGKLAEGAVDAGFVYATDITAAKGRLRAIELPAALEPSVVYEAAVVRTSRHPAEARMFVEGLSHGTGASALRAAGFAAPAPTARPSSTAPQP